MSETSQGLPTSVRSLWRQIAVGRALVTMFIGLLIVLAVRSESDASNLWYLFPVGVAVIVGAIGWWWATKRWSAWSFALTDRWVTASRGVWTRRAVTIPRNRVQTVTTNNGPLDRFLNLTSITIHTAGSSSPNLAIPHLDDSTIAWLRHELGQGVLTR